ncbi:MAG: MarR family winged helix-turn-helix transcriptional regulator [Fidelibacterota bacterium]
MTRDAKRTTYRELTRLENSTGFLVVRTARSMKKALDTQLVELGLTASQHTVLSTLAHSDGLSLSEVGRRVFLDKPAITGLADRLEKDGLVQRKRTSSDRRVIKLYLTPKGRKLLRRMNEIATSVDRDLVSVLTPEQLKQLRQMLNRIWRKANGEEPDGS